MTGEGLDGFAVNDGPVPAPPVPLDAATRDTMSSVLAAIVCGHVPERIAGFVRSGKWPVDVVEMLDREHEPEEMAAHVDVLLCVQEGALA